MLDDKIRRNEPSEQLWAGGAASEETQFQVAKLIFEYRVVFINKYENAAPESRENESERLQRDDSLRFAVGEALVLVALRKLGRGQTEFSLSGVHHS